MFEQRDACFSNLEIIPISNSKSFLLKSIGHFYFKTFYALILKLFKVRYSPHIYLIYYVILLVKYSDPLFRKFSYQIIYSMV